MDELVEMKNVFDEVHKHYPFNKEWLLRDITEHHGSHKYVFFWQPKITGEVNKSCLGQWYPSPFDYNNQHFLFAEQFMMAYKAKLFHDDEMYQKIMKSTEPRQMKKFGQQVRNFDSDVWDQYKDVIVYTGNIQKFTQNPELRKFLVETGDKVLVEASPYDNIWGIKMDENNPNCRKPELWLGENHLGFDLMITRGMLLV
ncbi:hypothetical protein EIN_273230 [Entamoeba invadens IP1]|uniref:NADAR domain-containing protein n=1 Tax=Entamoeba invadens IP1 TaxID=370355 RepID=A0A0A1U753_ENTIV|nr:hypothetical protein EIN_273230 [Entamoeba invadens IP1]ELP87806.1 hypothetical protein EIN_273230 [Entamoeba invadens IP1]|eukprot:XP_004254577.1 hypothetical protein EIN_273230 [Entamoeba invadens IP1]